jgi:ribosomal protein S18 acetylase RimI-like enzyme
VTDDFQWQRYDAGTVDAIYPEMVSLYIEVYGTHPKDPFDSVERFESYFVRQRAHEGFEVVTARIGGRLVGMVFGFSEGPGQYAVCEIMVAPDFRRRGIAKRLHDELLAPRPEPRAGLYVRKENAPAQAAYQTWGWTKIGDVQPAPDAPNYDELIRPLPLTTTPPQRR